MNGRIDMNDQDLIVTNLDHIPGRKIDKLLGMVIGYSSVEGGKSGSLFVEGDGMKWPWADTPQHYEALFKEAERRMREAAVELEAEGIIRTEGRLSRDSRGRPEVVMMGTAVQFEEMAQYPESARSIGPDRPRRVVRGRGREQIPEPAEDDEGEMTITIGGTSAKWTPVTATPSEKRRVDKKSDEPAKEKVDSHTLDLANSLGISTSKAADLIEHGFDTLEKVSKAEIRNLTELEGINPTQARLMIEKAKSTVSGK
ncbi:MAG: heavy metal-binding domain-containing protein [Thermoplasmatota archaeon]